jgi:pimeloyl-ACP methyl ester carboxylesterase
VKASSQPESGTETSYIHARTRTVDVNGLRFAYRQLGADSGTPLILLNHLGGNLDNWDPRVVDGLAVKHRVITVDNRGVGASEGSTPTTVAAMARDAVSFVRALGFDTVDLLGFSLGGFITQVIAQDEPQLVRRIVLAGTGPAGGKGIDKVTSVTIKDMIRAALTSSDPKRYLFFTRTANGEQAARDFLARLSERTEGRDAATSPWTFRAQLKAIHAWGRQQPQDLSRVVAPALVVNGDADRMVPSSNTVDLARRLPNSELEIYPDAGHGGLFQYHDAFVTRVLQLLERD